ncbi:hypothetical protein PFISCL1PPCAC_22208, partial [Pristionchus fissidentatus]
SPSIICQGRTMNLSLSLLLLPSVLAFYPPNAPFLSGFSNNYQAVQEYNSIVTNTQLTRPAMEQQMNSWANKYGMTNQITMLINGRATALKNITDNAVNDAQNLPSLIQKMNNIVSSTTITGAQVQQQISQLLSSVSVGQQKMAAIAFGLDQTNNGGFGNTGNNGNTGFGNNGNTGFGNNGNTGFGNN